MYTLAPSCSTLRRGCRDCVQAVIYANVSAFCLVVLYCPALKRKVCLVSCANRGRCALNSFVTCATGAALAGFAP
jgi:hypothetical protein